MKNDAAIKFKKALEILNDMKNNKYTMKYIEENKNSNKNYEKENINNNILFNKNRNISPLDLNNNSKKVKKNNKNYNRSSSYLNKSSKNVNYDKYKNLISKKINNIKDKKKDKSKGNNIHEYKIHNLSSSYNNNFTNIKTNKIVFIDLKNNIDNNFIKNEVNKEKNKYNYNDKYIRNIAQNIEENINNNIISKPNINIKTDYNVNNIKNINNKLNPINDSKHNNKLEDKEKNKILNSKSRNDNYIINKIKFLNLKVQKIEKNNSDNYSFFNNITQKSNVINLGDIKYKNLSRKECSYYILSKSPILRLCERLIFSRSSKALKNIFTKESILNDNQIILQNKIDELQNRILLCDKILETPFSASKTADITLNFITSIQEIEFKEYPISFANEEEKKYYINFLKILYHILNEEIENSDDENNNITNMKEKLYKKINDKGFKSIRDYLYNIFIKRKDYIREIPKIAEINYLISQANNMFEINNSLKICKFISFTLYLIKEIVDFGNNIKSSMELKIKAKNLIDIINKKINKYKSKYK